MEKRRFVGSALAELVEQVRSSGPNIRVGLMVGGSELGTEENLRGAVLGMTQDSCLQVVAIGAKVTGYDNLEWIETTDCEADISAAMELALEKGYIDGALALHYSFPLRVTTIGRVLTPARGKPLLIASCTGMSAASRLSLIHI